MSSIKKLFGETLRKQRTKNNRTQQEVAMSCDMSLRFYQDLEAGNKQPTITSLFRLCSALGLAPDKIIMPVWKEWQKIEEK